MDFQLISVTKILLVMYNCSGLLSHTIRKVKFLSKTSRVFHPLFLTIFLVKSKLSTAKKSKTTTFSRVFHPKKIDNFLGKSKLNFCTKNEDFDFRIVCKRYIFRSEFFENRNRYQTGQSEILSKFAFKIVFRIEVTVASPVTRLEEKC